MNERKPVDWERIEAEYRAGQLSVAEIARQAGISHTAINKRAKREAWTRDLSGKVRQEITARLVSEGVSGPNAHETGRLKPRDRTTIDLAASRGVELVRQHRISLGRAHRVAEKLVAELDQATDSIEEIEAAIDAETAGDKSGKRRAAMLRAVSLPSRATAGASLSVMLKNLITLERQAFNLDAGEPEKPPSETGAGDVETLKAKLAELGLPTRIFET